MLPRNPPPESFKQLLDAFRSSQRIHRLIELNLVAGANFALGWIRNWHPRLNFSSMSLSLPIGRTTLRVYMDATLQPARRIIARLLQEDAVFFREHHYLNPLMVDDSWLQLMWHHNYIVVLMWLGNGDEFVPFVADMLFPVPINCLFGIRLFVHVNLWGYLDKPDCCSLM
jgi:hypothetical protein